MRLGRVRVELGYVVDLDNKDMVQHARECLVEDLMSMAKYEEYDANIREEYDGRLRKSDIAEFLVEDHKDWAK
jgi:hypothetical protein